MTKATILIPTHNHGEIIRFPIESVLAQTHPDWELLVVGDGAPPETAALMAQYQRADSRIRYFDNPKGERHGEAHRHAALQEATGDVICYLSDDDIWCPDHLAYLIELLGVAEFAHTLPVQFNQDGTVLLHTGNLSLPESRHYIANGGNFIPLSHVGHTTALYRRLPSGWHPAPLGIWTDLYMWQQLLGAARSVMSGHRLTVLHFPAALRGEQDTQTRAAELASWFSAVSTPSFALHVTDAVLEECQTERVRLQQRFAHLELAKDEEILRIRQALDEVQAAAHAIGDQYHQVVAVSQQQGAEIRAYQEAIAEFSQHLDVLQEFHRERAESFELVQQERAEAIAEIARLKELVEQLKREQEAQQRTMGGRFLQLVGRIPFLGKNSRKSQVHGGEEHPAVAPALSMP